LRWFLREAGFGAFSLKPTHWALPIVLLFISLKFQLEFVLQGAGSDTSNFKLP
jgi:hypothetical protein